MALNNRSENRSGETFCAVVTRAELPCVAWFTYKWTTALREKSLLHVKPGAVKKGLHRISSCTLPIRLEEHGKCTIQVVSGRKRLVTRNSPAVTHHSGSVFQTQRSQDFCFSFKVFILQDFTLKLFLVAVACRSTMLL